MKILGIVFILFSLLGFYSIIPTIDPGTNLPYLLGTISIPTVLLVLGLIFLKLAKPKE